MDLDDFEGSDTETINVETVTSRDASKILRAFDKAWWVKESRGARWMDLLGDYAGTEPFVIDGESLLQLVLDDPLLALGQSGDISFQYAHAVYLLEKTINEFITRSAVFDVVFWKSLRHLTRRTGDVDWVVKSRALARAMLINHMKNMTQVEVHEFDDLFNQKWEEYRISRKPMFIMINDGTVFSRGSWSHVPSAVLLQRTFIFDALAQGVSISLLQGSQFRNTKILTFVFEQKFDPKARRRFSRTFWEAAVYAEASLGALDTDATPTSRKIPVAQSRQEIIRQICTTQDPGSDDEASALCSLFAAHCCILENLPLQARAQHIPPLHPALVKLLLNKILPDSFAEITSMILASSGITFDVDGRVFAHILHYLLSDPQRDLSSILGHDTQTWLKIAGPLASNNVLTQLRQAYPPQQINHKQVNLPSPRPLLAFHHPVFDDDLQDVNVDVDVQSDDDEEIAIDSMHFGTGTVFRDTAHWHNHKRAILPKYLGGEDVKPMDEWQKRKKLKRDQFFMARMNKHAQTLTGALGTQLQRQVIPLAGRSAKDRKEDKKQPKRLGKEIEAPKDDASDSSVRKAKGKPAKEPKVSSADKLRAKIKAEKTSKTIDELTVWWDEQLAKMDKTPVHERIAQADLLQRGAKAREGWLAVEIRVWRLHLELTDWIARTDATLDTTRDRFTVNILRMIKTIYDMSPLSTAVLGVLASVLMSIGLEVYIPHFESTFETHPERVDSTGRKLRFDFVKLIKSKSGSAVYKYMRIKEHPVIWQLRLYGEFMDRSMDSTYDRRVMFMPDAWQRKVLDCLDDDGHSVLVVAPTSAGKTFISYYAMEKVLRDSDDGILVYIAPTKALVSQIAAEVYARFAKSLKSGSLWAVHTRDYRIHDPQHCQILITVPEVLAIMLLSPPLARIWTPKIKRIILDEIHTIGQQEGGAVWEQILLLAPCPIVGLSATIGQPEKFNDWLASVQTAHGYRHSFIHHPHRYSHLRKYTYALNAKLSEEPDFTGLDRYKNTGRAIFLHPIGSLAFGSRSLPADLALESQDTLSLWQALSQCKGDLRGEVLNRLEPTVFFADREGLLTQLDIIQYESALKEVVVEQVIPSGTKTNTTLLPRVIKSVSDPMLTNIPVEKLNIAPSKENFIGNLLYLVCDLHVTGDLPAILFSFDRSICERIGQTLLERLLLAEKEWKQKSPQWQRKLQQWELWKNQAKDRAREFERLRKAQKVPKGEPVRLDPLDQPDTSWEASFHPNDPLPAFSFAGMGKYPREELDGDIRELARWSGVPPWILSALKRGIAIHHSGMNKAYRSLIESLFRQGFVRVMIATGTLALGINAPAKTSIFCGDSPWLTALMYRQCAGRAGRRGFDLLGKVMFYGVSLDRAYRLILSKLPSIEGNFPLTSTMCLRLLNLAVGSENAPVAVRAIRSLLTLPQISVASNSGRDQILHHLRFSLDYLRRAKLLTADGTPLNLYGMVAHLYYTEPANLALVSLFRAGAIHRICNQESLLNAKKDLVLLLANLFGRRYLPRVLLSSENLEAIRKKSPSVVLLPPISGQAREVLVQHDREILRVFSDYANAYATRHKDSLHQDYLLPVSQQSLSGRPDVPDDTTPFINHLIQTSIRVRVRSPFIASSGLSDRFNSVEELTSTTRGGLHLDKNAIPSMAEFHGQDSRRGVNDSSILNAYLYDFFMHGQEAALKTANGIRPGEIWYMLQEFDLVLMTIRGVVEQMLLRAGAEQSASDVEVDTSVDQSNDDLDSTVVDSGYGTGSVDASIEEEDSVDGPELKRPRLVSDEDWHVYVVIDAALRDFNEKFKAMWA